MASKKYTHWKLEIDKENIAWLILDREGASANSLNQEVLEQLNDILDDLEDKKPKGLVIQSGKASGFIAGADISQFTKLETTAEAVELIAYGQSLFTKLANVKYPTVALIHGFCLGGGLELALACKYRIALADSKTKLGLPEVMLGIQPGWGGSVRLPKLINPTQALDMILSGRAVSGFTAKKMGIVDDCVPDRNFIIAARYIINKDPGRKGSGFLSKIINLDIVRPFVGKMVRKKLASKVNIDHHPAPYAALDNWIEHNVNNEQEALKAELNSIAKLMISSQAKNLVRVFFLREKLKSLSKASKFKPKHVHVIGAGVMGGDIAAVCAMLGYKVTLQDKNLEAIKNTFKRTSKLYTKKLKLPHLITDAKDRLIPDVDGLGVSVADVIIEAIIEDPSAKQDLFAHVEKEAKSDAILATNTSTITLDIIRKKMQNKSRLVGIHFFNPVPKMPLVEIVSDKTTSKDVINDAMSFVGRLGKLPLPVKSSPGFLVNRVLIPYLLESVVMYEEGIQPALIDKAARDFGMPMGPVELSDTVGLDICYAACQTLELEVPPILEQMIKDGKLGKKTNQGFFKYVNGKIVDNNLDKTASASPDIADRLIMRMINESVACLREKVVADEDLLDAGMIFGTGFAPFLGGPMFYINEKEKKVLKSRLAELEERYGDRFKADSGWAA